MREFEGGGTTEGLAPHDDDDGSVDGPGDGGETMDGCQHDAFLVDHASVPGMDSWSIRGED